MKPTDCMNDKCEHLKVGGNAPAGEIGTCWYECEKNVEYAKNCSIGAPISEFKEKKEFTIKDSGERVEFSTGMVRDSCEKIRYDLIYMPMLTRWADHMTKGAKKYSSRNWERAETVEELDRFLQSAFRHFVQWFTNEDNFEDHASAVFFNISGAELVKEKLGNDWQTKLRNYQLGKEDK